MRCQLCGLEFDETNMVCHTSCAFGKHCAIICCPHCGYQVVDESKSKLILALRRMVRRVGGRRLDGEVAMQTRRLSELRPDQSGTVVSIEARSATRLNRLSMLGVVPGSQITLVQRQPAYVLRAGFTELSLEREVADEIVVELLESG